MSEYERLKRQRQDIENRQQSPDYNFTETLALMLEHLRGMLVELFRRKP